MTYVVAPSLTGYPQPGVIWLPGQWAAMVRGEVADLTADPVQRSDGLVCDIPDEAEQ